MNHETIAAAYRQASTRGSSPVGLVVRLYDAILEDFRRAIQAIQSRDVEARTSVLNHALQIVAELQNSLDLERGAQVARRLDGFYNVTRGLILEANVSGSREKLERLTALYNPVRQAWQQAEKELGSGTLQRSVATPRPAQPSSQRTFASAPGFEEEDAKRWNA